MFGNGGFGFENYTDYVQAFTEQWNQKVKSIRKASIVISILMVVFGILCMVFPVASVTVIEILAAIVLIAFGICEIMNYFSLPVIFQRGGILINAILNIIVGVILICSPAAVTISTFAFMFGFLLMIFGVDLLALAGKLKFFGVSNFGWVIVVGVLSLITSFAFFLLPLASTIALNYILAIYLLAGGIMILIESFSMKDLEVKQ